MTTVNPAPTDHFVLYTEALSENSYVGHPRNPVITKTTSWLGREPQRIYVDKGYRAHNYLRKFRVFKSGQKRGAAAVIKKN